MACCTEEIVSTPLAKFYTEGSIAELLSFCVLQNIGQISLNTQWRKNNAFFQIIVTF